MVGSYVDLFLHNTYSFRKGAFTSHTDKSKAVSSGNSSQSLLMPRAFCLFFEVNLNCTFTGHNISYFQNANSTSEIVSITRDLSQKIGRNKMTSQELTTTATVLDKLKEKIVGGQFNTDVDQAKQIMEVGIIYGF